MTITPVSGQTGTTTITLTVTDGGGLTATSTFVVTVNPPPNTAPTISTVANQTVTTGQSTSALAITVGDAETPVGSLTVTGSSSNTSLVASSGIVFGGSRRENRTSGDHAGERADGHGDHYAHGDPDGGGLTATSTFVVTVNPPPNTAPTISTVANQTVTTGQSTGASSPSRLVMPRHR